MSPLPRIINGLALVGLNQCWLTLRCFNEILFKIHISFKEMHMKMAANGGHFVHPQWCVNIVCPCGWPQKTNTLRTNSQLARSVDVSVFTSEFLVGYCLYWIKVSMLSQSVALIAFSLTTAGERPGMRSQGNLSAILQTAVSNLPIAAHNWKPNGDKLRCVGSERDTGCYVLPCTG